MSADFCSDPLSGSPHEQPNEEEEVEWPTEAAEAFWLVVKHCMDLRTCKLLEQQLRKGSGTERLLEVNTCCCSGNNSESCASSKSAEHLGPYCFRKTDNDMIGDMMQRLTQKNVFLPNHLVPIAERCGQVFDKMMAQKEAVALTRRQRAELQRLCITSAVSGLVKQHVLKERSRSKNLDAKDGGMLAYPSSYAKMFPNSPWKALDMLPPQCLAHLMTKGYALLPRAMEARRAFGLKNDLDWLEMNNVYDDQTPISPTPFRTDSAVWLNAADIPAGEGEDTNLQNIRSFLEQIITIPFELNKKASLNLTISNDAFFSLYQKGAYYQRHTDNAKSGSSSSDDNGRSVTVIYILAPGQTSDPLDEVGQGITIKIHSVETGEDTTLTPMSNTFILLRSRLMEYEICPASEKTYAIFYWCYGVKN